MAEKKHKKMKNNAAEGKQPRTMSRMNPNQKEAIIAFMEAHAELLSAAVSRLQPRDLIESLWADLTKLLNDLGHVAKTTNTWKKTWFDLRREVKAKLGAPPYPSHLLSAPGDMSVAGQRGRIAALMTRAVLICQQHAAASLRGTLQEPGSDHTTSDPPGSPPVVEMSVKCEPPDFAGFDIEELQDESPPPNKKSRIEDLEYQLLVASQDRIALAMEGLQEATRSLGEIFRRRNEVEVEKVEALKLIAQALQSKS